MSKKKDDYGESLKDPRWQKKRLEILNRDDWTCQICGAKDKELHVHHMIYYDKRKPWDYSSLELITLCDECHKVEHQFSSFINEEIKSLRSYGVTSLEIATVLNWLGKRYGSHLNLDYFFDFVFSVKDNRGIFNRRINRNTRFVLQEGEPYSNVDDVIKNLVLRRKFELIEYDKNDVDLPF